MAKKIVLMMLLMSLFASFVVHAENEQDFNGESQEEITYKGENLIEYLEIINPEVDLKSDFVTRELFALYVARMLKIDETQLSKVRYFSDVEYDSFSVTAINSLVEKGIISVSENHLFRPGEYITQHEALKMLICVLGYGDWAELNGGYPGGYMNIATKLDIYVQCENANVITVSEAGKMIYNALRADILSIRMSGTTTHYESYETFLERYWDICEAEGTVEAVFGASILKSYAAKENTAFVGGKRYDVRAELLMSKYIGNYVNYFYKEETDDADAEIVVIEKESDLENLQIDPENFEAFSKETISYYNENHRLIEETLVDPVIVYNGSVLDENLSETIKNINKGSIIIKDSNDDGEYDVIVIEDYRGFVISSMNDSSGTIYDKVGMMEDICLNNYGTVILSNSMGESITYSDLEVGQVLSVAASKDKEYIKIVLELGKFSGKLKGMRSYDDKTEITIEDEVFLLDETFINYFNQMCILENKYEFTIDSFNKVIYADSPEGVFEYGYIIKAYIDDAGEKTIIRLLTEKGEVEDIECAQKVNIDGTPYKGEKIYDALKTKSDATQQIIRYSLNNGIMNKIDTQNLGQEDEKTSMYNIFSGQERKNRWYNSLRLGLKCILNSNTVIFAVPDNIENAQRDDYFLIKSNELTSDKFYVTDAYKDGSINSYADAVVVYYDSVIGWKNNETTQKKIFVVEQITKQLYNDEVVTAIHGYERGTKKTVYDDENMDFSNVEKGDLLRFGYDRDGTLRRINDILGYEVIYDCSTKAAPVSDGAHWFNTATLLDAAADPGTGCLVYNKGGIDTEYYRSDYQISYGEVLAKKDNVVEWNGTEGDVYTDSADLSGLSITVVDEVENEIIIGSVDDIIDKESSPGNCSKIFFEQSGGSGKAVVIYNFK